jgi:hypothetical protein
MRERQIYASISICWPSGSWLRLTGSFKAPIWVSFLLGTSVQARAPRLLLWRQQTARTWWARSFLGVASRPSRGSIGRSSSAHTAYYRRERRPGASAEPPCVAHLQCEKQLVIVPGATHLFEEPGTLDEVARLARDWFQRHLSGRPNALRLVPITDALLRDELSFVLIKRLRGSLRDKANCSMSLPKTPALMMDCVIFEPGLHVVHHSPRHDPFCRTLSRIEL